MLGPEFNAAAAVAVVGQCSTAIGGLLTLFKVTRPLGKMVFFGGLGIIVCGFIMVDIVFFLKGIGVV